MFRFIFGTFIDVLYITKAASNTLIITGREKVTITSPVYLLVFDSQTTQEQKAFIVADSSTHPSRYQQFTFTEGSTAQKTLAIGTHYWRLFAQTSAVNIDPALATEEIDRGVAYCQTSHGTFNDNEVNTTIKQHHIG